MTQMSNKVRRMVHSVSMGCALAIALCLGFVLAPNASAQVVYGSITGNVQDKTGAMVA